jgi:hypothetical protein
MGDALQEARRSRASVDDSHRGEDSCAAVADALRDERPPVQNKIIPLHGNTF